MIRNFVAFPVDASFEKDPEPTLAKGICCPGTRNRHERRNEYY